jgi:hypothetical protein
MKMKLANARSADEESGQQRRETNPRGWRASRLDVPFAARPMAGSLVHERHAFVSHDGACPDPSSRTDSGMIGGAP